MIDIKPAQSFFCHELKIHLTTEVFLTTQPPPEFNQHRKHPLKLFHTLAIFYPKDKKKLPDCQAKTHTIYFPEF